MLARCGARVIGMDVDPESFEPAADHNLRFLAGSVDELPFADASFDIVASYQMLEHVDEPELAIEEMARVVRPGGVIIVAGPNLLSPANSVRQIVFGVWRNRPLRTILFRREEDPHLPFGHTLPEALLAMIRNLVRLSLRGLGRAGNLPRRLPDWRPPSRGDKDACNLLNPLDVAAQLHRMGWRILSTAFPGRPRWTGWIAGGTWVAARKPT